MRFLPPTWQLWLWLKGRFGIGLQGIQRWTRWWWSVSECPLHHLSRHSCLSDASSASICVLKATAWRLHAVLSAESCYTTSGCYRSMSLGAEWEASTGLDCRCRSWNWSRMCRDAAPTSSLIKLSSTPPAVLLRSFRVDYDDNGSKRVFFPRVETMTQKIIKTGTKKWKGVQTSRQKHEVGRN